MKIRNVKSGDSEKIAILLDQLGYHTERIALKNRIDQLLNDVNHCLVAGEDDNGMIAVMSVHFVPQIALNGEIAIISYIAVDATSRGEGMGTALEEYCVWLAKKRNCEMIQLHCDQRRTQAHKFYEKQGYTESPKYFSKKLI
ncbi:MAG: GNAT family N-acetyltransferase [Pedobacter sp.]|nr:MAG: GNAT family N-acetyltransferase [Pedobacter sp.]